MPGKSITTYEHHGKRFITVKEFEDESHIIDKDHILIYDHGKYLMVCFKLKEVDTVVKDYTMLYGEAAGEYLGCKCGKNMRWHRLNKLIGDLNGRS